MDKKLINKRQLKVIDDIENFITKLNKAEVPEDLIDKGTYKDYKFYNDILNLLKEEKWINYFIEIIKLKQLEGV